MEILVGHINLLINPMNMVFFPKQAVLLIYSSTIRFPMKILKGTSRLKTFFKIWNRDFKRGRLKREGRYGMKTSSVDA